MITRIPTQHISRGDVTAYSAARYVLPLRGRSTQSGHFVSLLQQRITCIPTIDIPRSDVTAELSSAFLTLTSHFPSYTPHVPAKPKTLSRQKCSYRFSFRKSHSHQMGEQCSQFVENCAPLYYYAASSGNFLPKFQDNISDLGQEYWIPDP
jgi:hypothetical protein